MENQSKITCPECGAIINVQDVLKHQLEDQIRQDYNRKLAAEKENYDQQQKELSDKIVAFEEKKRKENEMFQDRLDAALKKQLEEREVKLKSKLEEENSEQMNALQSELNEKSEKIKELNRSKAEIEKLKREKDELKEAIEAESQKKLNEQLKEEKDKIRKSVEENKELEILELKKQIEDQKKLTEQMKKKQEQGSMQMQGEVQELAIEELLAQSYPFDDIAEVPKGVRGADCIQTVINNLQQSCGTIVYESKRTKNFSKDWIDKLKQDQVNCKADIAVLVTESFPVDIDRFGEKNGIWICGFHEIKSVSLVLREMLIKTHSVVLSQENKGDKMELLYNYLTSTEFKENLKRIGENYSGMINQLNAEKNAMHKLWKQREKQIWVVQENIAAMFGSIEGIAGDELGTTEILQLNEENTEEI